MSRTTRYVRYIGNGTISQWSKEKGRHPLEPTSNEEKVAKFREEFARRNPDPEPGIMPVKYNDLIGPMEPNRCPLEGGPLDGLGLAKVIKATKGAGKNKLTVLIPIEPNSFQVNDGEYIRETNDDGLEVFYSWNTLF